jgi:hypothetical protein
MELSRTTWRRWSKGPNGRSLKAGLLLGLLVFVVSAAYSWAVHHAICAEADNPTHHCAARTLANGQVDTTSSTLTVVVAQKVESAFVLLASPFCAVVDCVVPPSRAPPALLIYS